MWFRDAVPSASVIDLWLSGSNGDHIVPRKKKLIMLSYSKVLILNVCMMSYWKAPNCSCKTPAVTLRWSSSQFLFESGTDRVRNLEGDPLSAHQASRKSKSRYKPYINPHPSQLQRDSETMHYGNLRTPFPENVIYEVFTWQHLSAPQEIIAHAYHTERLWCTTSSSQNTAQNLNLPLIWFD